MHLRPLGHLSGGPADPAVKRSRPSAQPEDARCATSDGGESGIRTHGTLTGTPDFESGTFGRSVISPPRTMNAGRWTVNALETAEIVGVCRPARFRGIVPAMRTSLAAAVLLATGVAVAQPAPPAAPTDKPASAAPAPPAPASPAPGTTAQPAPGAPDAPVAPVLVTPDPAPPPPSTPPPAPPPADPVSPAEKSSLPPPSSAQTPVPSERAKQDVAEPSAWQNGHAIAVEAVARVGGRLGPAAYTARSEERAGLGYKVGGWFTLSQQYVIGFGLARQDLGQLVVSDGASTASAGYASTALELGARAFPFRPPGFDLYLGLHVGLAWQHVEASGLTAPEGFQPGHIFTCSDLAGPAFGLGAEVGAGLELTRALWLTGVFDASGYRHSADAVGNCVGGIGSVTTLSFGAGLLYAFDIGAERALAPSQSARR
jgi:hypothetical protein